MKKQLVFQIVRFILWGLIPTTVDVCILVTLNDVLGINVLVSSAVAFIISATIGYFVSMRFVFNGGHMKRSREYVVFVLLSLGGLFINQGIMYLGTNAFSVHYLVAKLFSVLVVPAYNFITKKVFLEK